MSENLKASTVILALILGAVVWYSVEQVATYLEEYEVYVGIYPFGVVTHPYAWLAPIVRIVKLPVSTFAVVFILVIGRGDSTPVVIVRRVVRKTRR